MRRKALFFGTSGTIGCCFYLLLQVFEDDWILSQAPDSGCPSESLLEEEVALDKTHLDLPAVSNRLKGKPACWRVLSRQLNKLWICAACVAFPFCPSDQRSSVHLPPPAPSRSSPTHEHLGLEWDPSVDIGRSLSQNDADSSYFSANTGRKDSSLSSMIKLFLPFTFLPLPLTIKLDQQHLFCSDFFFLT